MHKFLQKLFLKENAKYDIYDLVEGLKNFRIFFQKFLIEINGSIEIEVSKIIGKMLTAKVFKASRTE